MKGTYDSSHQIVIRYQPENGDKLMSPDGTKHFLPCENKMCGEMHWVAVNVVSFFCDACSARAESLLRGSTQGATVIDRLPPINWAGLGREALSRGEHKQLSDREITEVNQCIYTGYGRHHVATHTREHAVARLNILFAEARERYADHVREPGNAGAPEEING